MYKSNIFILDLHLRTTLPNSRQACTLPAISIFVNYDHLHPFNHSFLLPSLSSRYPSLTRGPLWTRNMWFSSFVVLGACFLSPRHYPCHANGFTPINIIQMSLSKSGGSYFVTVVSGGLSRDLFSHHLPQFHLHYCVHYCLPRLESLPI